MSPSSLLRPPALVMVVLCLFLGTAGADAAAGSAIDTARRHVARLEYDQALAVLAEARRALGDDPAQLAETWLLEAYVDVALDREEEARAAFRKALRLQPELVLARELSPKVRVIFDSVASVERARAARRRALQLQVQPITPPPVAEHSFAVDAIITGVQLDPSWLVRGEIVDRAVGLSALLPMTVLKPSPAGAISSRPDPEQNGPKTHLVLHVPAEFVRAAALLECRVEVVDEGEVVAQAPPSPAMVQVPAHRAALLVLSPVAGATVYVNGKPLARLPMPAPVPHEPGPVTLQLRAAGGTVTQEVLVRRGDITSVTLALGERGSPLVAARWSLVGTGGALVVVGGALAGAARAAARNLENGVTLDPVSGLPTTSFEDVRGFQSSGRAFAAASIASFVVGGAAAVTGAALFGWPLRGRSVAPPSLRLTAGFGHVTLQGAF